MKCGKIGRTSTKKQTKLSHSDAVSTDFGVRKISNQNFSKVIALPKTAIENLGGDSTEMKVELIQENGEKFIKLSPIRGDNF
ncbi:MAG: hypothetical protein KGZ34_00355 [Nitrosarchaeum sp.]|nr:hypothetical protein [Nitrosarchaeum sp.]